MITWTCAGCGLTAFDRTRRCECETNVVISSDVEKVGCRSAWKVDTDCGSETCCERMAALEAAARLGLEMAKANDLWNTAEEIEQALAGHQSIHPGCRPMSNYRDVNKMPSGVHEALWQMFKDGPIWDGNLVCKTSRKWLREQGYAEQSSGFNFLTAMGVDLAVSLGMDRRKEKQST